MKTKLLLTSILFVCLSLRILAGDNPDFDTVMLNKLIEMSIEDIIKMKVTIATKTEQAYEQAPAITTVITQNEIQNMGARELSDVLQMVPGFEITKNSTGSNLMGVRGVKDPRFSCKILLLQDGQPVNEIFYGAANFYGYRYDMADIERIEIIRGPGSAVYGRNAFSAVINIITKTGKTDNKTTINAEIGSFNTYSTHLSYGYAKKDLDIHLSGYAVKTDGTDAINPNTEQLWAIGHNNQVINMKANYKDFRSSFSYINERLGDIRLFNEDIHKTGLYTLEYSNDITEKINLSTRVYGLNTYHQEEIRLVKPNPETGFLGMYVTPSFNEHLYGGVFESKFHLFEGNDFLAGFQSDFYGATNATILSNFNFATGVTYPGIGESNQTKWEPGWVKDNGHNYTNFAVFLQDIYYPVKKLGITLGARYDMESHIGGVFSPRLGLVYQITPKTNFKVMYGQAYRSPSASQQYQTSGFAMGNENLKPERIKTLEAAFTVQFTKLVAQINVFHNELTDMIYAEKYITTDVTHTPSNRNMGKNISNGIETEIKYFIGKNLYTFLNYSYTRSENTDNFWNNIELNYQHVDIAPHKINAGFNYNISRYLNLNSTVMYRSKMKKFFSYDATSNTYTDVSQDPVGNYAIINSTLRVVNFFKGMEISGSVYNILNTKYYAQDPSAAHAPQQGNRQFIVRVGYRF